MEKSCKPCDDVGQPRHEIRRELPTILFLHKCPIGSCHLRPFYTTQVISYFGNSFCERQRASRQFVTLGMLCQKRIDNPIKKAFPSFPMPKAFAVPIHRRLASCRSLLRRYASKKRCEVQNDLRHALEIDKTNSRSHVQFGVIRVADRRHSIAPDFTGR